MCQNRLTEVKTEVLIKLSKLAKQIESVEYADVVQCAGKYHGEEDPFEVAVFELIYSHIINIKDR